MSHVLERAEELQALHPGGQDVLHLALEASDRFGVKFSKANRLRRRERGGRRRSSKGRGLNNAQIFKRAEVFRAAERVVTFVAKDTESRRSVGASVGSVFRRSASVASTHAAASRSSVAKRPALAADRASRPTKDLKRKR